LELWLANRKQVKVYRLNDALTNISCGIVQQVFAVLMRGSLIFGYLYLHEHYRLADLGAGQWWVWVICFVGVDFFYYWFHRYAHEISIMWGGHIVHHQSEEYNLSVALRQGAFQGLFSWIFYLPLALMGFDPLVFLVVAQFQTLYQFWIHTRLIGRMPAWFEFVFNTPSHHRVHHGINPKYIDKNHGGTLIIFDRMFGTFQLEEEEVVYGVTKPLASWNPVWANFDYFKDLFQLIIRCKSLGDMLRAIFKGPGWRPAYLGGPQKPQPVTVKQFHKFDTAHSGKLGRYVFIQFVLALLGASAFLVLSAKIWQSYEAWQAALLSLGSAGLIYLAVSNLGALLAGKSWGRWSEMLRMLAMLGMALALTLGTPFFLPVLAGIAAFGIGSMLWLRSIA
jgi:sterol desaturase/sphingolipid hydroxylase (fatty acid hydroxylase superfamily)